MMSPPFPVGIRLFLDMSEKDPKSVNSLSQFRYRFAIRVKRKYSYKWHMSCWIVRDLFAFLTDNSLPAVSLPVDMPVFVSKTDDSEAATEREYWINERNEIFRIEDPRGKNTHRRTDNVLSGNSTSSAGSEKDPRGTLTPMMYPVIMPYSVYPMTQEGEGTQSYPMVVNQPYMPVYPAGEGNGYVTYVDNMGLVYYAPMTLPQGEEPRQESSREV